MAAGLFHKRTVLLVKKYTSAFNAEGHNFQRKVVLTGTRDTLKSITRGHHIRNVEITYRNREDLFSKNKWPAFELLLVISSHIYLDTKPQKHKLGWT